MASSYSIYGSWKKQRIQDHFVVLCNELDVDRIVPILRAERMLTSDEHEQLTNRLYTTRSRREKLLLFIPRKGKSHFEKFVECLVWSGQSDLARKLGVPVQEIRPSPHPPVVPSLHATNQEELLRLMQIMTGLPSSNSCTLGSNPIHPYAQPNLNPHVHPAPHATETYQGNVTHSTQSTLPTLETVYPIPESNPTSSGHYLSSIESLPPPAVLPEEATIRSQTAHNTVQRQHAPFKNVFILYSNEEAMEGEDDFSEFVREMSRLLIRTCGQTMAIHCDMYVKPPPPSWPQWTEELIKKSDCVLYVCSKSLSQRLSSSSTNRSVQMKFGSFDATTVYNMIESPKFVPVFLNTNNLSSVPNLYDRPYISWVPTSLLGASRYWLDLESLHRCVGETMSEEEYAARLAQVLGDERMDKSIRPIADILRYLQGVPDIEPPAPFPNPIVPPAAGPYFQLEPTRPELTLTDHELLTISQHILRDWQSVGIKLGLSYTTLENLRLQYVRDCQQAIMEMFKVWQREKKALATRTALKGALKSSGYARVAEKVFSRD